MLGQRVLTRRKELGLSVSAAARQASINRATWSAIERGERETEEYIYGSVERALNWQPGSIDAILSGKNAEPATPTVPSVPRHDEFGAMAEWLRRIANNPNRAAPLRAWAASQLDQIARIHAEDQAEARARGERGA